MTRILGLRSRFHLLIQEWKSDYDKFFQDTRDAAQDTVKRFFFLLSWRIWEESNATSWIKSHLIKFKAVEKNSKRPPVLNSPSINRKRQWNDPCLRTNVWEPVVSKLLMLPLLLLLQQNYSNKCWTNNSAEENLNFFWMHPFFSFSSLCRSVSWLE